MTTDQDIRIALAKFCGAQFATISDGSWANVNIPGGQPSSCSCGP